MQQINFDEAVEQVLAHDSRYAREAYFFVREALEFTQKLIRKENHGQVRHVTVTELLDGLRQYALTQFGPMTVTVFEEWGIRDCGDLGEIVFNGPFTKTEADSRADFQNGYNFVDAFQKPFWSESRRLAETKSV